MAWWLLMAVGVADAASPAFALDDLDVTLTLPEGSWRLRRWSAGDLGVTMAHPDGPIELTAWSTPVQVAIVEGSSDDAWAPVFESHIASRQGFASRVEDSTSRVVADRPVALTDLAFRSASDGSEHVLRGATVTISGANLHLATTTERAAARAAAEVLHAAVAEILGEPAAVEPFGGTLQTRGARVTLPPTFRRAVPDERVHFATPASCQLAVLPRPAAPATTLTVCDHPGRLGVVDTHTFDRLEPRIRSTYAADAEPATPLTLPDRVGFGFVTTQAQTAVVPSALGVVTLTVAGPDPEVAPLSTVLQGVAWSGPHPTSLWDWLDYWVVVRPMSAPVLGATGIALALAWAASRAVRRNGQDAP